jgi:hypothetical protein
MSSRHQRPKRVAGGFSHPATTAGVRVSLNGLMTGSPGGSQRLPSQCGAVSDHACSSLTNCKGSQGSSNTMSRRQVTHPVGFIVTDARIDSPYLL